MKIIAIILISILTFIGCGKKTEDQIKTSEKSANNTFVSIEKGGTNDPIANADAIKGGTYTSWGSSFPKSLNMWLDYNSFSKGITELQFEVLATLHSVKNEPVGILAESWTISEDLKAFIFKIHDKAQWSDGKPITSEDVQFYYDVMMDPKNLTSLFRVSLKRLNRPEIVDEKTIKITTKENHWLNFWTAAELVALPKHVWQNVDFNKQNFEFPVVSGPYKVKEVKKNRYITLQRRDDWWGQVKKYNQYKYNFDIIKYKCMEDRTKALEAFKTGIFDAYSIYTSSIWVKQTDFESIKNGWVIKQNIYNQEPKAFQGLVINLRRPKFQDPKIREALCYLFNRQRMNEKLMFNQYFLLNSYYPDLYPGNKNPNTTLRGYDPDKARVLLKEGGCIVGSDGLLRKDGKIFEITFISFSVDHRHLNIYLEDLKRVGIKASIEQLSHSTFTKRVDNHQFDMFWRNWAASRLRDPEAMWHSKTADQIATNNVAGVKDAVIDSLIEMQKTEMSLDKRNDILKQIDNRLTTIVPYVLMWQADHTRLLYWNRFGTPEFVLDKFNREDVIPTYWWLDPDKANTLKEAKKNNTPLPTQAIDVSYKE